MRKLLHRLRRRFLIGSSVTWDEVAAWCRAHGAKNDRIVTIRIQGRGHPFVLVCEGWEEDDQGRPYIAGHQNGLARWQSAEPLRYLP